MRLRHVTLALSLFLAACGDDAQHGGAPDMAVPDLSTPDLSSGSTSCNPTDPMTDGSPCSAGCPSGTIAVNLPSGECKCLASCNDNVDCSCNRFCDTLTKPDAGVVGKACVPGNPPGERCGTNTATGAPYYDKFCGQLTLCINADPARMYRYCSYKCKSQSDCPAQTTCQPATDGSGNPIGDVCAYTTGPNGNVPLGMACKFTDVCQQGLCDGTTCKPQCDGPGATCTGGGTCTRVDDPTTGKVIGYVCK